VKGPSVPSIFHYACFNLALKSFLHHPGDGRMQPQIPASSLSWGLLLGAGFGDDALAYFTERLDPEVIRHRAAATLKLAKRNKVFEETAFIGLAIDGTGAGRSTKGVCPLCHPVQDSQGKLTSQIHHFVMISVVGAGITLPFDVEPYKPDDSEYGAGKRLLKRSVSHLGPRFADYVVVDAKFATAPFLHAADGVGIRVIARLKANLPELSAAVEARFSNQPPTVTFQHEEDRIEAWDADDFDPWETLAQPTVRVLRYRQRKPDGTIVQADWLTDFSIARLGARSFFKLRPASDATAVVSNFRPLRPYPTARRRAERRPPVSFLNFPKPLCSP